MAKYVNCHYLISCLTKNDYNLHFTLSSGPAELGRVKGGVPQCLSIYKNGTETGIENLKQWQTIMSIMAVCRIHYFLLFYVVPLMDS